MSNHQAGKGDKPRKVIGDKFRQNYDDIFKKPCEKPLDESKIISRVFQIKKATNDELSELFGGMSYDDIGVVREVIHYIFKE